MKFKPKYTIFDPKKFLKTVIFFFPLVFIFLIILNRIIFGPQNDIFINLAKEDGPVEVSTAIFYFMSFLFSILIGIRIIKQKKNLFALIYFLFSIAFFLIAFEEISWGQRIFSIDTSEYFKDNLQDETNIHNFLKPMVLHYLTLVVPLVVFILWAVFTSLDKLKEKIFIKVFTPQGYVMSYFILALIFYESLLFQVHKYSEELNVYLFKHPGSEIFEFFISVGIFIFITSKFFELKNQEKINSKG